MFTEGRTNKVRKFVVDLLKGLNVIVQLLYLFIFCFDYFQALWVVGFGDSGSHVASLLFQSCIL